MRSRPDAGMSGHSSPSLSLGQWQAASRFGSRLSGRVRQTEVIIRNNGRLLTYGFYQVKCTGKRESGDSCTNCARLELQCSFSDPNESPRELLGMLALPLPQVQFCV